MKDELKEFEKKIKTKYRFGNPKYEEEAFVSLDKKSFIPVAKEAFRNLEWDVVYDDSEESLIEAKRRGDFDRWTEKITVTYDYRKIKVRSESLGNELCDNGRNSKRVKLFIYAFQQVLENAEIEELTTAYEKEINWDDYVIPDSLPEPPKARKPNGKLYLIGTILSSLLIACVMAFVIHRAAYAWGIFELATGFILGFVLVRLVKWSNYIDYSKNKLICIIILLYVSSNIFLYIFKLQDFHESSFSFFSFIKKRFSLGITTNDWMFLFPICIALQTLVTWYIAAISSVQSILKYAIERVPPEVTDFTYYLFLKEKTEEQVREELSQKGWTNPQSQDEAIESIVSIQSANQVARG